jgi:phosphate-selective porin
MITRVACVIGAAALAATASLEAQTLAPSSTAPAPRADVRLSPRPTLRLGAMKVALTGRLQADLYEPSAASDDMDFDVARRRLGVAGTLTRHLEFEIEREFEDDGGWRDAFVNLRTWRAVQVRAGRFKMPFSLDRLTSASALDFVSRSRGADLLAPGRSTGVSLHGRVAGQVLGYDAGVFAHDGDEARFGGNPGGGTTIAGRLTIRPRGAAPRSGAISDVELGVSATEGDTTEGRHSLRGRLTSNTAFFSPVFVKGRRLRVGGDLDWRPGPFGFRAEYLRADDARHHQGLMGETLPPVHAHAWYVSGTWAVAGRRQHAKADNRMSFAGLDGLELAARVERVWFGTGGATDADVRTPRATQLAPVSDRVWTLGVNWTLNRFARLQFNAVHERVSDRAPGAPPVSGGWAPVVRVQVGM